MPITPFIGVRISWLMLARNWLFAWLAASAAFLATSSSSRERSSSAVRSITFWSRPVFNRASSSDCRASAVRQRFIVRSATNQETKSTNTTSRETSTTIFVRRASAALALLTDRLNAAPSESIPAA